VRRAIRKQASATGSAGRDGCSYELGGPRRGPEVDLLLPAQRHAEAEAASSRALSAPLGAPRAVVGPPRSARTTAGTTPAGRLVTRQDQPRARGSSEAKRE
jgi:hypothetical protein